MLHRAVLKSSATKFSKLSKSPAWIEADALQLPFADASFSLVTSAFGFRNLANYDDGLKRKSCVYCAQGESAAFSSAASPRALWAQRTASIFTTYCQRLEPALSGVRGPYDYLPSSVGRFPKPAEMLDRMRARRVL